VLLALAEGDGAGAREQARQMAAALAAMGPEAVPEHQIMAHYDLAKFWSGQNDHDTAFGHWQAGHALLRRFQPFSREAHGAFIDTNIALLDRARFATDARVGNADPAPVFIVGMPRSGTTLCEQILAAHAQVHGAGERAALGQMFAALGGGHDSEAAPARVADANGAMPPCPRAGAGAASRSASAFGRPLLLQQHGDEVEPGGASAGGSGPSPARAESTGRACADRPSCSTQVRQPVNARGLGRWRTYASRLEPLIAELEQAGALEGWDHPPPCNQP
jgi:hypothetical protein